MITPEEIPAILQFRFTVHPGVSGLGVKPAWLQAASTYNEMDQKGIVAQR
jgi:hypothetical protein